MFWSENILRFGLPRYFGFELIANTKLSKLDDIEELSECEVRRMSAVTGSVPAMDANRRSVAFRRWSERWLASHQYARNAPAALATGPRLLSRDTITQPLNPRRLPYPTIGCLRDPYCMSPLGNTPLSSVNFMSVDRLSSHAENRGHWRDGASGRNARGSPWSGDP